MAGNITIITPKDNFLKVPKGVIFNEEVDALTLGVYVKVLALGRKWQLNVPGLARTLGLSVARIKAVFAALEKTGYLRRCRVKGEGGRFTGWDYEVSSEPITDHPENRPSENSELGENRPSENGGGINRDYIINRDNNTLNKESKGGKTTGRPSVDDVREYAHSIGYDTLDVHYFIDYYTANGWTRGKSRTPIKDWKAVVRMWKSRETAETKAVETSAPGTFDQIFQR